MAETTDNDPSNGESADGDSTAHASSDQTARPRDSSTPNVSGKNERHSQTFLMRLNDHDFACLLDEIAYAASNQLPIPETLERIGQARLGRVGRVAKAVASHLRSGRSLADAVSRIKSPSASLVRHAFTSPAAGIPTDTVNVTDDRNGVRIDDLNANLLSRLSMRIRDRANAVRMRRLMWFYPLVLVTIAYCILLFAAVPLINQNQFNAFYRPNGIHWANWFADLIKWISVHPLIPPIVFLAICLVVYLVMRRRPCFASPVRKSLFCHTMADQLIEGVPEHHAITTASALSGYDCGASDPGSDRLPTLRDAAVAKLLNQAGGVHQVGDEEQNGLEISSDEERQDFKRASVFSTVAQFRYLGNSYQHASKQHQRFWTTIVPQIVTVVFGFVFMTGYVWLLISPIYREVQRW